MANKLTLKQENFILAYIETGNASEAYRRAYDAQNMKAETIGRNAKALMDNSKIATRLNEVKAEAKERCLVTVEALTERLLRIAQKAEDLEEAAGFSVSRAAAMDVAKLNGLVIDKAQNENKNEVTVIERKVVK